ncbi:hypothetical protein R0J91_19890, partial [Micrococcus sp. SIMBA_131]
TPPETTAAAAERIERVLLDTDGVETVQWPAGTTAGPMGAFGGSSADRARFTVVPDPDADQVALQDGGRAGLTGLDGVGDVSV